MKRNFRERDVLPEYPHVQHLSCLQEGDVATEELSLIFNSPNLFVEEKIDGANCGVSLWEGNFIVRNRTHILHKGVIKDTPAKKQFASIWNFLHDHKQKFILLNKLIGTECGVYAEWLYALHGIRYDLLPAYFVPFEIFLPHEKIYLDSGLARRYIEEAGFSLPPLLHQGPLQSWSLLNQFCCEPSVFSSVDQREGVFLKVSDGKKITHRFKVVRQGFTQGCSWNTKKLARNGIKAKNSNC